MMHLFSLEVFGPEKSFKIRTGTVAGTDSTTRSDSVEATSYQNCVTGGQSHIICKTVPGYFRIQKEHRGDSVSCRKVCEELIKFYV